MSSPARRVPETAAARTAGDMTAIASVRLSPRSFSVRQARKSSARPIVARTRSAALSVRAPARRESNLDVGEVRKAPGPLAQAVPGSQRAPP
jgi:hypothetical protein